MNQKITSFKLYIYQLDFSFHKYKSWNEYDYSKKEETDRRRCTIL
jgi:hypothetical protein